jgi:hypothetical protein
MFVPESVADPGEKSTCGELYILLICVTGTIIYKKIRDNNVAKYIAITMYEHQLIRQITGESNSKLDGLI